MMRVVCEEVVIILHLANLYPPIHLHTPCRLFGISILAAVPLIKTMVCSFSRFPEEPCDFTGRIFGNFSQLTELGGIVGCDGAGTCRDGALNAFIGGVVCVGGSRA